MARNPVAVEAEVLVIRSLSNVVTHWVVLVKEDEESFRLRSFPREPDAVALARSINQFIGGAVYEPVVRKMAEKQQIVLIPDPDADKPVDGSNTSPRDDVEAVMPLANGGEGLKRAGWRLTNEEVEITPRPTKKDDDLA